MANWASIGNLGNPADPAWQAKNLTWIEPVPGQRWQVYKDAAPQFAGLIKDLVAEGYQPHSSGGFNYRNIRGSDKLSQHAFGTAIDINADSNALGSRTSDIPHAAELAKKYGLEWGGGWSGRPDPMHFEYAGGGSPAGGQAPADASVAGTLAGAVDPRAAAMAMLAPNPWKDIAVTDAAPKRGGLVGAGSAGGGLTATPGGDPGIPPLETASATVPSTQMGIPPGQAPVEQLGQLADLFKVGPIGQAPAIGAAQAQRQQIPGVA